MGTKQKHYDREMTGDFRSDVMLDLVKKSGVHGGMSHTCDPGTSHPTLTEIKITSRMHGTAEECFQRMHELAKSYECTNYCAKVCEFVSPE